MVSPQTKKEREKITEYLKLYSVIVSLVAKSLQGVADATTKCAKYPGPPRCIETRGGKDKKMQGGVGKDILVDSITGDDSSGAEAVRITEKVSGIVLGVVNDYIVPYVENQILGGDINSLSTEDFTSILQTKTKNIQRITTDPKMQKAIKELIMAYTTLIIQIIDIAQPDINIMTDKVWKTISETINQSVIGAFSTGFNISAAIPFVGEITDIIDLASSIGKSASPTIRLTTDAIDKSVAMASKIAKTIEAGQERINQASNSFNQARQVINNPVGAIGDAAASAVTSRVNKASDAAASAVTSRVNKASDAIVKKATPRAIMPIIKPKVAARATTRRTGGGGKKKIIGCRATKKRNKKGNKKGNMKKMKRVTMRKRK